MPKEVITLQLGSLSCYTGAHFWNLQDEALGAAAQQPDGVAEDVLFAWSEDAHGAPVYYPRLVALDLSGATGGVSFTRDAPAAASGSGAAAAAATWGGGVEVVSRGHIPRSAFTQQLELQAGIDFEKESEAALARHQAALEAAARELDFPSSSQSDAPTPGHAPSPSAATAAATAAAPPAGRVRYWTDYLKARLHPRSVHALSGAWHGSDAGFEGYGAAEGLLAGAKGAVEAVVEGARWWSEQCDSLQGIQVFADDLTGFGGITRAVLDEIRDELPGSRVLLWGLRDTEPPAAAAAGAAAGVRTVLSDALACAELSDRSALFIPIGLPPTAPRALPLLQWAPGWGSSPYVTGALLAAAIDTATLPMRLMAGVPASDGATGATDLHSWVHLLANRGESGANFAAAALQLPAGAADTDEWRRQREADDRAAAGPGSAGAAAAVAAAVAAAAAGGSPSPRGSQQQQEGRGVNAASSAAGYSLSTLEHAAVLLPGAPPVRLDPGTSLAESIVLRGPRRAGGGACPVPAAAAALDTTLRSEPRRMCVVHRCVAPGALAVPLPFPGVFGPGVGRDGDVVATWTPPRAAAAAAVATAAAAAPAAALSGGRDGRHVAACPVLTRVAATSEFEGWLSERARGLRRAGASAAGRPLAEGWGYGRGDLEEAAERLQQLAGSFADDASDDGL